MLKRFLEGSEYTLDYFLFELYSGHSTYFRFLFIFSNIFFYIHAIVTTNINTKVPDCWLYSNLFFANSAQTSKGKWSEGTDLRGSNSKRPNYKNVMKTRQFRFHTLVKDCEDVRVSYNKETAQGARLFCPGNVPLITCSSSTPELNLDFTTDLHRNQFRTT